MRRRNCLRAGLVGGLGLLARSALAQSDSPIRVLAASDLKFVLTPIANQFQRETGHRVDLGFGSSGNFARQLQQGLKADLFMSADEALVFQLADADLTRKRDGASGRQPDRGALYGRGRIAFVVPLASTLALDAALHGVLTDWGKISKFAIANPEHAPYGRAAQQALQHLGLWQKLQSKLVLGENIAQATQYVLSGAAQAGITALSLALAPELAQRCRHLVLPETLHQPLRQRMVLLKNATPAAQALYAYLQGEPARAMFGRYGFSG